MTELKYPVPRYYKGKSVAARKKRAAIWQQMLKDAAERRKEIK